MTNRFCVLIDDKLIPVNNGKDFLRFSTGTPNKIGDDAMALFKDKLLTTERKVKYLKSHRMFGSATYLVDLDKNEAWPYDG